VYMCRKDGCEQPFKNPDDYKRHQNTVHLEERPFKCPESSCKCEYGRKDTLFRHITQHHDKTERK
ncbi:hypothetical protein B0H10DRAFT_1680880, partial [Mycena sp. CBHHK59/15]